MPPSLPLLGHTLAVARLGPLRYNERNWRTFGDVVRLHLGPFVTHVLAHPDHIRHVLIDNRQNYNRGRGYRILQMLTGMGLLTSDGADWERHRRAIQPPFTPKAIRVYVPVLAAAAGQLCDQWDERPHGRAIDVNTEMLHLAMQLIGRTLLSEDLAASDAGRDLVAAFETAAAIVGDRIASPLDIPLSIPTPRNLRFRRARATLDRRVDALVAARAAMSPGDRPDDLLTHLLAADGTRDLPLRPDELRDELLTLFFAGHETIAQSLTWTWHLLGAHADAERRLHDEVDAVLCGRPATVADLPRLPYTRQVVEEAMRLYPAVWAIPRGATGEDEIGGYGVPAGSSVYPVPYLAHRHPDFWERPLVFDPDRFESGRAAARPPGCYLPFGIGPRACVGQYFAMQEAVVVVATIAQRYRLVPVPGHHVEPRSAITLGPRDGLPMFVTRRGRIAAGTRDAPTA